jgi:diacylglycerol kinase (ATP)
MTEWIEGVPASSNDADAILIFGGDGTIHRHLAALVRLKLPVLVVPAGSGNDFARALNLRSAGESLDAWRDFEAGKKQGKAIDLGVITSTAEPESEHYFCGVAGCGLDAAVARRANEMPRWLRRRGGYALALLPTLFRFAAVPMRLIERDDLRPKAEDSKATEEPTILVAFANSPFYGDGMRIAPQADLADGELDVCRISKTSPVKLLCMFPTVYFGRHLWLPQVAYWRTACVRVETTIPLAIYADGEFVCETPAEISVARRALEVIAA